MKKQLPSFSDKGFTLLELIVVFSIIAILSTVGIASYVNYSASQTLRQAYYDVFNTINYARASAGSQVKPDAYCIGNSSLDGYSVVINKRDAPSLPNTYILNVLCSGQTFAVASRKSLPNGVVFNTATDNPPTTTTNIFFSVLTSGVSNPGNIVLSYPGNSNVAAKTIKVTSVGGIQ